MSAVPLRVMFPNPKSFTNKNNLATSDPPKMVGLRNLFQRWAFFFLGGHSFLVVKKGNWKTGSGKKILFFQNSVDHFSFLRKKRVRKWSPIIIEVENGGVSVELGFNTRKNIPPKLASKILSDTTSATDFVTLIQFLAVVEGGFLWSIPQKNMLT